MGRAVTAAADGYFYLAEALELTERSAHGVSRRPGLLG
jgi:hypothetical protein